MESGKTQEITEIGLETAAINAIKQMSPLAALFSTAGRVIAATTRALLSLGCNEQVDESYSTYSEAQRAGSVKRGWIPYFVPSSARNLDDAHDLDTSRQTLRFTISPSSAADKVSGLRALSAEDKTATSKLIDLHALAAASKVYVICSEYRNRGGSGKLHSGISGFSV